MRRYWTCHWQNRYWRDDRNPEYQLLCASGANTFRKRGVAVGDIAYVVSLRAGQLFLGGRMTVERIVSRPEAVRLLGNNRLYDAKEWILDDRWSGTPLNLHRRLAPEVSKRLLFISPGSEPKPLFFVSEKDLDVQATRGVRQLTRASAMLLDQIIEISDGLPRSKDVITVTDQLLAEGADVGIRLPEEVPANATHKEGNVRRILVNRYERDPNAREDCIRHYGSACFACGFDFYSLYGDVAAGFIHVHHVIPLSSLGPDYEVNPAQDLRPVCPNCHAVLHRREPPYSIEELRRFLKTRREASDG
jgi:hypothetical protein